MFPDRGQSFNGLKHGISDSCAGSSNISCEYNLAQLYNFNQKWSGIPIRIAAGVIWIRMCPDLSQNVADSFILSASAISPKLWENQAMTVRNANKSPRILYSTMVRKMKNLSGNRIWDRSPTKVNQFFQLVSPIITAPLIRSRLWRFINLLTYLLTSSFNEIGS